MSIRIGLCRFSFPCFCSIFAFGLCCCVGLEEWEGMGWKSGRDGWGWKVKLYTIGKTVFLLQFGGRGRGVTANKENRQEKHIAIDRPD